MTTLLDLNQDCLNIIFSYLNIYELIDVEDTCAVFKIVCEDVYASKKYHSIKLELRHLKIEYVPRILEKLKSLRSIEFSGGYLMKEAIKDDLVEGISTHCHKLSRLTINYMQFDKRLFDKLQSSFQTLIFLNLSNCSISDSSTGLHLDSNNLKNLKELKLSGNASMSGAFFKDITCLEILDVSHCYGLRYYEFLQFLRNCKRLISLNVTSSPQLIPEDQNIIEDLLIHQPYLEILLMDNIGIERDDDMLRKFKHLKHTSFSGRRFGT